ncbi:MAG: hypothetical protein JNJ88_01415 [Planctomycetes bacterium]|nr:hypothetical protein [Planctomycetota bacterium]
MMSDPQSFVRDVECLLREVESLVERLAPGLEEARRKVEALEWMRRSFGAFDQGEVVDALAPHVDGMRERIHRTEARLRAAMAASICGESPRGATPTAPSPRAEEPRSPDSSEPPAAENAQTSTPIPPHGLVSAPTRASASFRSTTAPRNAAPSYGSHPHGTPAPVVPPDPEDLEKIRALEEECEREFGKLHFLSDEERHAMLTVAAAKARRLRTRVHDSYAVDRRLGDLIRKIVDLKRRYRLGWIDGCERTFDVPDWDAYVERCEDHFRELRMRDTIRQEEQRLARERAHLLAGEVDRRGRELRAYLDTDEGRHGTEPEKLRAVLMSYLSVDGPLDNDLLDRLRVHRALFTGIAFRRLRKGFERLPGPGMAGSDDTSADLLRLRERVAARLRGQRAVVFAGPMPEEGRRRLEVSLHLEQLSWIDLTLEDALPRLGEITHQAERRELQFFVRSTSLNGHALHGPAAEAAIRELAARAGLPLVDVEHPEDADALAAALDRALPVEGGA